MKDLINSFNKMNFDICDYFSIIVMLIATWVFKVLGFDRFHTKFLEHVLLSVLYIQLWLNHTRKHKSFQPDFKTYLNIKIDFWKYNNKTHIFNFNFNYYFYYPIIYMDINIDNVPVEFAGWNDLCFLVWFSQSCI
jgi:hypothetical protein